MQDILAMTSPRVQKDILQMLEKDCEPGSGLELADYATALNMNCWIVCPGAGLEI